MANDTSLRLAFIGAGNMANSLIRGLLQDGLPAANISVADPIAEQLTKFEQLGVHTHEDNAVAVADADVVILAVKPQVAAAVVGDLTLQADQLLLSIAAGIDIASLAAWSSEAQAIVRCMPNTPALLGAGMTGLYANESCSPAQKQSAERILQAAGKTLWVSAERDLDAVTAVSGSGPAYFFLLMEAMIDAGEALGLEREQATALTLQTAYGAARMALESDDPPAVLRQNGEQALADGKVEPREWKLLQHVARSGGVKKRELDLLLRETRRRLYDEVREARRGAPRRVPAPARRALRN